MQTNSLVDTGYPGPFGYADGYECAKPKFSPGSRRSVKQVQSVPVAETPVKKKRGRPPKPTSLTNKITTTVNIAVNTSPLSSSPTAESNSNEMMKQGAPDFFTPLMRVSPSNPRKKKRKTVSSPLSEQRVPKQRVPSGLATPQNQYFPLSTPHISGKTLDNISSITQNSQGSQNQPISAPYMFYENNLLPPASFKGKDMPPTPQSAQPQRVYESIKLEPVSDFSLTVDDSGKAVFTLYEKETFDKDSLDFKKDDFYDERAASAPIHAMPEEKPNLLRRHNSDFSGVAASSILTTAPALSVISEHTKSEVVPQTPNYKENYLYSAGFTPTSFNLTPQFSSMMYQMMNMNSPAPKKSFISNQDMFMGQEMDFFEDEREDGDARLALKNIMRR